MAPVFLCHKPSCIVEKQEQFVLSTFSLHKNMNPSSLSLSVLFHVLLESIVPHLHDPPLEQCCNRPALAFLKNEYAPLAFSFCLPVICLVILLFFSPL